MTRESARAEARLERFLLAVERIRVEDLLAYAARPADPAAHQRARETAVRLAADLAREQRVGEARAFAEGWVLRLFSRSDRDPGWYDVNWGRPGTVEDRAWLASSLGTAVMAVLLADELPDDVLDELLGPWGALVA